MPIITPPNDNINEIIHIETTIPKDSEWIKKFLTAGNWICSACGLKNHNWNKACANFRCKKEKP
jgi:hypothetical protein